MRKLVIALFGALLLIGAASAQIVGNLPFNLQNGTIADANQVMSDLNTIVSSVNANAATAGANTNITALNGLTTPLVYTSGGSSNYIGGTSTGSANAQVIASPIPNGFTLVTGKSITFIAGFNNTGPTTLNVNSTGVTNLFRQTVSGAVAMVGGELVLGQVYTAVFDGTEFQLQGLSPQSLVPTGTIIDVAGIAIPSGYLLADGSAKSRTTFASLFNALSFTNVSATTNSNTTVNITNASTFIQVGWYIGGNNVTCNSFVTAVGANTITISQNAGATGATTLTIGPYQQGDCSTTFNLPNLTGKILAGVDGTTNITTQKLLVNIAGFTNSSAVITAANSFVAGDAVTFTTTGSLPTNFATLTTYYVISTGLSSSQFEVSATPGGSAIVAGSAGSGTQSVLLTVCPNAASVGDKTAAPNLGCGSQTATLTAPQLPSSIPYTDPGHSHTLGVSSLGVTTGGSSGIGSGGSSSTSSNITNITINPNGGIAHSVMGPVALVYKAIKT